MADVLVSGGISWVDDKFSKDQPLVLVSGLSTEENLHMVMRKVSRCSSEIGEVGYGGKGGAKAAARPEGGARKKLAVCPTHHSKATLFNMSPCPPAITTITVGSPADHMALFTIEQPVPEGAQVKSHASLKDLCPEDKRRIANLIQELARVNEEKDETSQRLRDEQESFERKIQQLEEQNQLIVQERQNLQQQYHECQELLGLYQQYLTQQQEKLNESIAQLQHSGSKRKVTNSEDGCARPLVQEMDGSYLGLNPYGEACSSFPGKQSWTAVPSHLSSCSKQGTGQSEGQIQKNGCLEEGAKFQSGSSVKGCFVNRVPGCLGALEPCNSHHSHYVENCKDDTATELKNGYSSLLAEDDKRRSVREESDKSKVVAAAPSLALEDWKEKKYRLMLQKMELEVERARLQTHVMQRKEHILRQNQQLHHSHLKQNRFQGVEMAKLEHSGLKLQKQEARDTEQNTLSSQMNVRALPGELEDVTGSTVQPITEKLQNNDASASCASNKSVFLRDGIPFSSQDDGTSPLGSQTKHRAEVVQVLPHKPRTSPAHLDSSVTDLLEVLSPASRWNQRRCFMLRHPMQQFHSVHEVHRDPLQAQFIPRVSFQPPSCTVQDSEERQILEEIFFIC